MAPVPGRPFAPLTLNGGMEVSASPTPPKIPRPEPAPRTTSPMIEALSARLDALPASAAAGAERSTIIAEFWARHERTPVIEAVDRSGECTVTFLWRDAPERPAEDVLLFVNRLTDERDLDASRMDRVADTDVWHLSYRMRDDWRASYNFHPRGVGESWAWNPGEQVSIRRMLDRGALDPRNPLRSRNRGGVEMSVVELPGAPPQPWFARREDLAARGRVARLLGPGRRPVWLYTPPRVRGLEASEDPTAHPVLSRPPQPPEQPLPIVVLFDGEVWAGTQSITDTIDNLIADGLIRPCLVVMPESGDREERWARLRADGDAGDWVVNELLPWVRSLAPASMNPGEVIVAGQSLGGYMALRCALEHPEAIGGVLSQSASLWQRELRARAPELVHRIHAYIEVGMQEWVLREPNRELAAAFVAAGADVHFVEYNGGHDYACWRGGLADGIRALIGPPLPASASRYPDADGSEGPEGFGESEGPEGPDGPTDSDGGNIA